MRYTFDDNEDEDSESGVRRSTRNSGRESSAAPAAGAPTVTASGRQVRSRNAGLYGEALLSGQTTEHASPATGDYVRSEDDEEGERPGRGRAARAANRGAAAAGRKRTYGEYDEGSEGEEDATSWNGDDEEDDEPDDQMDVDVDLEEEDFSAQEDDAGPEDAEQDADADAEQEEQEQEPHLIVRLKVPARSLGAANSIPSSPPLPPAVTSIPDPAANMDAARPQPVLASAPPPQPIIPPPVAPPASLLESVPALPVPEAPVGFGGMPMPMPVTAEEVVNGGPVQAPANGVVNGAQVVEPVVMQPVVVPGKGVEGVVLGEGKGVVVTKGA